MKTPITDKFVVDLPKEYDWSDTSHNRIELEDYARRLERDRAALMEALEAFIEEQCEQRPSEYSLALGSARTALAAARANFPEQP